jgi:glycosyltransferase involved in cell wall biosynthesis
MRNQDFIITGLQSWDIPVGSNAIDIAKEISTNNRVLYVNGPLDMMTILRNKPTSQTQHRLEVLKKQKDPLRKINENLWVLDFPFSILSVNGLPDGFLFDMFNKMNNKKIFRYVKKVAEELGFTTPVHLIDNDIYRSFYSKEFLAPKLSVYYRRDNVQPYEYWKKHAVRLEPLLIKKSDLIVCNSPQLSDYAKSFNIESYDVGQGVDLSAYNTELKFNIPANIQPIPKPRIGYIGDIISMRLDADLICELAKSKPDYSFIMIGNEDKVFAAHELHQVKNVYFLGRIPKDLVPEYMASLDVCLNPQLVNEVTIGNYPRKVDEYLAMGKPVLATRTKTMELFKEHVYLCDSLDDYKEALEKSLNENSKEKGNERIHFAQSHSWENNVKNIYKCIQKKMN